MLFKAIVTDKQSFTRGEIMRHFKAYATDIFTNEIYVIGGSAICRKQFMQECASKGFKVKWFQCCDSWMFDQIYLCKDNSEIGGKFINEMPDYEKYVVMSKSYIDIRDFYRIIDHNYYKMMRTQFFKTHVFDQHVKSMDSTTSFWTFEDGTIWEESEVYIYNILHMCISNSVDDVIYYLDIS